MLCYAIDQDNASVCHTQGDGSGNSKQDQMAFICNIIIEMGLNDQNTMWY